MVDPLQTKAVVDEGSLRGLLDRLEQQLEEIQKSLSELTFTHYQTKQRPAELEAVESAQAAVMTNPDYQELVANWLGRVSDPVLARRLEVWHQQFRMSRVSGRTEIRRLVNDIADGIVQFRYQVQGDTLDLGSVRNVLRSEPDRERRRAAWLSLAPLSQSLDAKTRQLFRLRNAAAREDGFQTYAHMQIDSQGLQLQRVKEILEELAQASNRAYRRVIDSGVDRFGLDRLEPWDVKFLLDGQGGMPAEMFPRSGILPRLEEWGRDHGLELNRLGISVHFMDIPYNGLCMYMKPGDIRILGNPANGLNYYKTGFHELGHALHGAFNDPGSYILRREPSVFSEGMAEMIGYTVDDPAWLAHFGLSAEQVTQATTMARGPWFAYLRQRSAHALFEYEAYANPDGNLEQINAEIEARLLGCSIDASPRWASEPNAWYSRYPVYWQNYVLADVVASQIHHDLRRRFGSVWRNPEAIAHVRKYYWEPGGSIDWQEKIRRGTGEVLGTRALVADLSEQE